MKGKKKHDKEEATNPAVEKSHKRIRGDVMKKRMKRLKD